MFPQGKVQKHPEGFEDITNRFHNISIDSKDGKEGKSAKFEYVHEPPNSLGFRVRRPITALENNTEIPSRGSSMHTLPGLPELSTPEARQARQARLIREAKAKEEAERTYVALGGTLVDSQGKRDHRRTAVIRKALAEEEERRRIEQEKLERKLAVIGARDCYETRWATLLSYNQASERSEAKETLTYDDIPWPVFGACRCHPGPADLAEELRPTPSFSEARLQFDSAMDGDDASTPTSNPFLNPKTLGAFLFHPLFPNSEMTRRDVIHQAFLRWHPDKFNPRVLERVLEKDRESVKLDAGRVVQILADWKDMENK